MPPKIRDLEKQLKKAGFANRGGKGDHRNWKKGGILFTIDGKSGQDAKPYQIKGVKQAIDLASR